MNGQCMCCGADGAYPFARCRPCRDAQPKPTLSFDFTSDCQGDYRFDMAREAEQQGLTVSRLTRENT